MERKYDYELKLRSESEMNKLIEEYHEKILEIAETCRNHGLGTPDTSSIKYPEKLYVVRTEKATGEKSTADISDCTYRTIYPLLTSFNIGIDERKELYEYLNLYTTYEEMSLYLKEAQKENMKIGTIADIFTPLTKYSTVKSIADFNAMENRGEKANLDDYIRVADKCSEHAKLMLNSKK